MASNTPEQCKKAKVKKRPALLSKRDRKALYRPYALAIADLILAWNGLHEEMGRLFGTILCGTNGLVAMAAWHALRNDALQRDMLKAICQCAPHTMFRATTRENESKRRGDMLWLVDEVGKLRTIRDDVIHAPLAFVIRSGQYKEIVPSDIWGNRRAANLAKYENIIREILFCAQRAGLLDDYANQMHLAIHFPEVVTAWPDRPSRPSRTEIRIPYQYRPHKERSRPLQPSQG